MSDHAQTEFEFLSRMYPEQRRVRCIVCGGHLENCKALFCPACQPLLERLEADMDQINFEIFPDIKFDTALAYLALSNVLSVQFPDAIWISRHILIDALEEDETYQTLTKLRSDRAVELAITKAMKMFGFARNNSKWKGGGTYIRMGATA